MTVDQVVKHFGSQRKAAQALGLSAHTVLTYWRKKGIPYGRQVHIELATNGKLKAKRR